MLLWLWWLLMLHNAQNNIYLLSSKRDPRVFIFVLTNIYRSTFPVMHYTNTCMFSGCSPPLERSLSTIAELAFVSQVLEWFEISSRYRVLSLLAIGGAELFCWMGILSGLTYWHALEESIWCLTAVALFCNLKLGNISKSVMQKRVATYLLGGYILYMTTFDVPMYLRRPNSTKSEILVCENMTTDIKLWNESLIWMSGYFIIGSKISLIMA